MACTWCCSVWNAELVEEEDGCEGVVGVFSKLLVHLVEGVSDWARCYR